MKSSKRILLTLALLLCSCAGPRPAGEGDSDLSLVSIVEVEAHFARVAAQKGMRDSFLEFLADDGIIFRPDPVNGRDYLLGQEATPGLLSWRPIYAEVARTNDLGYTTGPWELRSEPPETDSVVYGHYVSIWQRGSDGDWRLLLDMGISHNPPREAPSEVVFGPGAVGEPESVLTVNVEAETQSLLAVDRLFSGNSVDFGAISAYMSFAAEDIRYYQEGLYPVKGKKETRKLLSANPGLYTWEPVGGGVSRSGELGFTFGSARLEKSHLEETETERTETPTGEVEHRSYLRIWRKDIEGNWNLALDMSIPLPQSSEEAGE